jgi:hypothetical protein
LLYSWLFHFLRSRDPRYLKLASCTGRAEGQLWSKWARLTLDRIRASAGRRPSVGAGLALPVRLEPVSKPTPRRPGGCGPRPLRCSSLEYVEHSASSLLAGRGSSHARARSGSDQVVLGPPQAAPVTVSWSRKPTGDCAPAFCRAICIGEFPSGRQCAYFFLLVLMATPHLFDGIRRPLWAANSLAGVKVTIHRWPETCCRTGRRSETNVPGPHSFEALVVHFNNLTNRATNMHPPESRPVATMTGGIGVQDPSLVRREVP